MDNRYKIIVELYYWKDKLKIPNFLLGIDNRTEYVAYVLYNKEAKLPMLFLNFKALAEEQTLETIGYLLHELGHIKHRTYIGKFTTEFKIRSEYLAESFAIKNIIKYLPQYKDLYIKSWKLTLMDKSWQKEYKVHYKAFSQIKEYKGV